MSKNKYVDKGEQETERETEKVLTYMDDRREKRLEKLLFLANIRYEYVSLLSFYEICTVDRYRP